MLICTLICPNVIVRIIAVLLPNCHPDSSTHHHRYHQLFLLKNVLQFIMFLASKNQYAFNITNQCLIRFIMLTPPSEASQNKNFIFVHVCTSSRPIDFLLWLHVFLYYPEVSCVAIKLTQTLPLTERKEITEFHVLPFV